MFFIPYLLIDNRNACLSPCFPKDYSSFRNPTHRRESDGPNSGPSDLVDLLAVEPLDVMLFKIQ